MRKVIIASPARTPIGEVVSQDEIGRDKEKSNTNHVEADYSGQLAAEDSFYIGCLKGIGRVCKRTHQGYKLRENGYRMSAEHTSQENSQSIEAERRGWRKKI